MAKVVSLVTALKKGDKRIAETINSLVGLKDDFIEYMVKVNYNLVDEEVLELATLLKTLSISTRLILQKDNSLYDGLNQALSEIEADFFVVIGAGDKVRLSELVSLKQTAKSLLANEEIALLSASIYHEGQKREVLSRPDLLHRNMFCPHPALFTKTKIAKQIGGFNTAYRIAADYDLTLRIAQKYPKIVKSDLILVDYEGNGLSEKFVDETNLEAQLVRRRFLVK